MIPGIKNPPCGATLTDSQGSIGDTALNIAHTLKGRYDQVKVVTMCNCSLPCGQSAFVFTVLEGRASSVARSIIHFNKTACIQPFWECVRNSNPTSVGGFPQSKV